MAKSMSYNFKKVAVIIAGVFAQQFAEGTVVTSAPTAEKRTMTSGADGSVTFLEGNDPTGTVTLVFAQNSEMNALLQELYYQDDVFSLSIVDNNTGGVKEHYVECKVQQLPERAHGAELNNREWVILVADYDKKAA